MIRKAILVLFTLYLGTSVWVFGGGRHTHFGSPARAHHSHFVPSGHTRQLFHRRQQLTRQSFHRRQQLTRQSFHRRQQLTRQSFHRRERLQHQLFHLHQQFHHQLLHLRHGLIHNFQFFRLRPRRVSAGFKVVRIPGQRVKSGRSSKWFAPRWVTIKSDRKSISPTELVPVWSSGQWSLKWKETPE